MLVEILASTFRLAAYPCLHSSVDVVAVHEVPVKVDRVVIEQAAVVDH